MRGSIADREIFGQGYHIEHHKFMGEDGIDTDLPTKLELALLNHVAGKAFFACVLIPYFLPPYCTY